MLRMRAIGRSDLLGVCVLWMVLLLAGMAQAQSGAEEFSDEMSDMDGFDDLDGGGFDDFGDGDMEEVFGLPRVTGLIIASETLAPALAEQLTEQLNQRLSSLVEYEAVGNDAFLSEFEIMGEDLAKECAFDPVCMGRIGRDAGVDYIVIGRVESASGGQWSTTLDLMDAGLGQIDNFVYFTTPSRTVAVQESLTAQLNRLFRIRVVNDKALERGEGRGQRILGWSLVGLGVAAIGGGVYFGVDFMGQKKDLEDYRRILDGSGQPIIDPNTNRPVYDLTQREAQRRIDEMNTSRNISFAMIGGGAAVAITGAVLVAVSSGKDIHAEADTSMRYARHKVRVAPSFSRGGFGVVGGFEF